VGAEFDNVLPDRLFVQGALERKSAEEAGRLGRGVRHHIIMQRTKVMLEHAVVGIVVIEYEESHHVYAHGTGGMVKQAGKKLGFWNFHQSHIFVLLDRVFV
jgi:hypothetical protein